MSTRPTTNTTFWFSPATKDRGYLAQLQEWANHYHVQLTWGDSSEQVMGVTTHYSYPISCCYTGFKRSGPNMRTARGLAADTIVCTPGVLDEARSLRPHPQPAPLRSTR